MYMDKKSWILIVYTHKNETSDDGNNRLPSLSQNIRTVTYMLQKS